MQAYQNHHSEIFTMIYQVIAGLGITKPGSTTRPFKGAPPPPSLPPSPPPLAGGDNLAKMGNFGVDKLVSTW